MSTQCTIQIENNPSQVLSSGEVLRGNVKLSLTKPKKVKGIFIDICGRAICEWTTGFGSRKNVHKGKEEYLYERIQLFGESDGNEVCLQPGIYNYRFECMLPSHLPMSFEGEYGHIRYTACVIIIANTPWSSKEFIMTFTLIKPSDLNLFPALRKPLIGEDHALHYPRCCSWKDSEPLDIIARVPTTGYTPGQIINLQIEANNQMSKVIFSFIVQLIQQIHFYKNVYSSISKHTSNIVAQQEFAGCRGNSEANLNVEIVVPSVIPTQTTESNLIKVDYLLHIRALVEGSDNDARIYLPIVIGTVPFVDNSNANLHVNREASAPMMENENVDLFPNAPPYPRDDPPTYEEAI